MSIRDGDNMPRLIYDADEIEETGKHIVNKHGYLYVGRKHEGKILVWIKLKEQK